MVAGVSRDQVVGTGRSDLRGWVVAPAAIVLTIAYLTYGRLLSRLLKLDPKAKTPAVELRDDVDYSPIEPKFLMSQHFSESPCSVKSSPDGGILAPSREIREGRGGGALAFLIRGRLRRAELAPSRPYGCRGSNEFLTYSPARDHGPTSTHRESTPIMTFASQPEGRECRRRAEKPRY